MFGVCCATKYTHSSLLAGSHCTVALFRGIVPRIKIHHSGRAICGASKLFDNSEQVFEPCRIVLKELKMRSSSHYNVSTKKRRHNKTLKLFFFCAAVTYLWICAFLGGLGILTSAKSEGWVYCTINKSCGPRSIYEDQTLCYTWPQHLAVQHLSCI